MNVSSLHAVIDDWMPPALHGLGFVAIIISLSFIPSLMLSVLIPGLRLHIVNGVDRRWPFLSTSCAYIDKELMLQNDVNNTECNEISDKVAGELLTTTLVWRI